MAATGAVTAITETAATLGGTVNPKGLETSFRFEYGLTAAYGTTTASAAAGSDATGHAVSAPLVGLEPHTTYHYRIVASNGGGFTTGNDASFTTPAFPPVVVTGAASAISATATLGGTVNPRGTEATYRFDFGTDTTYGVEVAGGSAGAGGDAGAVSAAVAGLQPLTTYHYRVVATGPGGTVTGQDAQFTTAPTPVNPADRIPVAATGDVSAVTTTSVTLTGTLDPRGTNRQRFRSAHSSATAGAPRPGRSRSAPRPARCPWSSPAWLRARPTTTSWSPRTRSGPRWAAIARSRPSGPPRAS